MLHSLLEQQLGLGELRLVGVDAIGERRETVSLAVET
jgi:hypothetical protein